MKITLELLNSMVESVKKTGVRPIEVYIVMVGDKTFMCPAADVPKEIAPSPCEIMLAKFPT